jgi:hypothetical protein
MRPSRNDLHKGFLELLKKLQLTLIDPNNPSTQQDRKALPKRPEPHPLLRMNIPIKTGASLAKNTRRAIALADTSSEVDLYILLMMWDLGLYQIGRDGLADKEMGPVLARLDELMKAITPKRTT